MTPIDVSSVRRPIAEANHAPGAVYASAEFYQLDVEKLSFFGRIDVNRFMIAWPDGPNRSRTIIYQLFPEAFFERPDFRETLKIYRDYQLRILEEDRPMIESMQVAMSSPAYRPGRMSTLEKPLHHYLNGYLDRVLGNGKGEGRIL